MFVTLLLLTPTCSFKVYNFRGRQLLMFLVQNIQVAFAKQQRTYLEDWVTISPAQNLSWKQRQHRASHLWPGRCVSILSDDCACANMSYPSAKHTSTGQPCTSTASFLKGICSSPASSEDVKKKSVRDSAANHTDKTQVA